MEAGSLTITNDAGGSAIFRKIPAADWASNSAGWSWSVSHSVAPSNLRKKGGDDRNIAIYFVFAPIDQAEKLSNSGIKTLLSSKHTNALVYTNGGSDDRGATYINPYMKGRGQSIVLRSAGTGTWNESVNHARDYKKSFGSEKGALIGIVVTSDSDDSKSLVKANISGLKIGH